MGKTIVCHCEDITLGDLHSALAQGYREIESLKRFTGIATGKCQGKCCLIQTLREIASAVGERSIRRGLHNGPGEPPDHFGPDDFAALVRLPTIRQPVVPVSIDDLVDSGDFPADDSRRGDDDTPGAPPARARPTDDHDGKTGGTP